MHHPASAALAKKSFAWGVLSIFLYVLIVPPIITIVSGLKARRIAKAENGRAGAAATAGLVLGVVMLGVLVLNIVGVVYVISMQKEDARNRKAMVVTQIQDIAKAIDGYHAEHGKYPTRLRELGSSLSIWDMWHRELAYAATESGFIVGTRGESLDDPNDDFYWESGARGIVYGPMPASKKN